MTPETFAGKFVLIGPTAAALFDLKASPLSSKYPGVECQATAILNLLRGQAVRPVPTTVSLLVPLACAVVATAGVMVPRRATVKLAWPLRVVAGVLVLAGALFRGDTIRWLSPVSPVLAAAVAGSLAFARTYFLEDRQRRFVVKALGQYVSPAVAERVAADPDRLKLGGERREMSVLFTDIAGFTDFSERLDVERLSTLLNYYLDEVSDVVLANDGTLDKYVGDAVMAFRNAPARAASGSSTRWRSYKLSNPTRYASWPR